MPRVSGALAPILVPVPPPRLGEKLGIEPCPPHVPELTAPKEFWFCASMLFYHAPSGRTWSLIPDWSSQALECDRHGLSSSPIQSVSPKSIRFFTAKGFFFVSYSFFFLFHASSSLLRDHLEVVSCTIRTTTTGHRRAGSLCLTRLRLLVQFRRLLDFFREPIVFVHLIFSGFLLSQPSLERGLLSVSRVGVGVSLWSTSPTLSTRRRTATTNTRRRFRFLRDLAITTSKVP